MDNTQRRSYRMMIDPHVHFGDILNTAFQAHDVAATNNAPHTDTIEHEGYYGFADEEQSRPRNSSFTFRDYNHNSHFPMIAVNPSVAGVNTNSTPYMLLNNNQANQANGVTRESTSSQSFPIQANGQLQNYNCLPCPFPLRPSHSPVIDISSEDEDNQPLEPMNLSRKRMLRDAATNTKSNSKKPLFSENRDPQPSTSSSNSSLHSTRNERVCASQTLANNFMRNDIGQSTSSSSAVKDEIPDDDEDNVPLSKFRIKKSSTSPADNNSTSSGYKNPCNCYTYFPSITDKNVAKKRKIKKCKNEAEAFTSKSTVPIKTISDQSEEPCSNSSIVKTEPTTYQRDNEQSGPSGLYRKPSTIKTEQQSSVTPSQSPNTSSYDSDEGASNNSFNPNSTQSSNSANSMQLLTALIYNRIGYQIVLKQMMMLFLCLHHQQLI